MSAMSMQGTLPDADRIVAEAEAAVSDVKDVRAAIGRVIYGQETVIERVLITLLAGGHGLLIGVPGAPTTALKRRTGQPSRIASI